jgi:imidazolonepropionase-like amidohydrolase
VVPTLVNIATFPGIAERGEAKFPAYAAHMRALHARRRDTVRAAFEAGVPVFVGTDAGSVLPHGLVVDEVLELVAAGLPPPAALDAATWAARRWLGVEALTEGASADLLVLAEDPRADVGALRDAREVVLRGRRVRRA